MNYLWVAIGSALGGMARYWSSGVVARLIGERFPWGTLIVNVSGSLVIGAFAALSSAEGPFLIRSELRISSWSAYAADTQPSPHSAFRRFHCGVSVPLQHL
jgi:CrcB protein